MTDTAVRAESAFNIASLLTEAASLRPEQTAVIAPHRPDVLGRRLLSNRELDESSNRLARWFLSQEAAPGSRILLLAKPGPDFFSLVFGLFKAGLCPVMVDPGMGLKRMLRCLAEGRAAGLAGLTAAHLLTLSAPHHFRGLKLRLTLGRRLGWGGDTLAEIMNSQPSEAPGPPLPLAVRPDDTAAILFTSGSTGPAKGVVYTHAMFHAQIQAIKEGLDIQPGGVDLATFPLFGLFAPALGLTSVLPDINPSHPGQADPRRIVEPILKYGVTSMFASPTLLEKTSRFAHEHNLHLPSLRKVISAGAPVRPKSAVAFSSLMPADSILMTPYGATEGVPLSRIDGDEIALKTRAMTEQGLGMCVGRPLPKVKLGVIAIDDGPIARFSPQLLLPTGEIGEIVAQGPMVSPAYFQRPQDTAMSIIADEEGRFWRRMGDLGWLDTEGRLWFCGRKNHRVVTENGTLFSIPCEAIFNNHPQVRRSALVGLGKPGRQTPVIIIEPHPSFKAPAWEQMVAELGALAKANPRTINISTFLKCPKFPVDVRHNAKINREELAVWAGSVLGNGFKWRSLRLSLKQRLGL